MSTKFKHTPKEARKLWVASLRSGEYQQTTERLRHGDAYCCLGVACELFRIHEGQGEWTGEYFLHGQADCPPPVQEWLGLAAANGSRPGKCVDSLASKNDNGTSFDEIADIIELSPPGLFVEQP